MKFNNINLIIFLWLVLLLSTFSIYGIVYATNVDDSRVIELCCTWGEKLADGVLTYSIESANPAQKNVVNFVMAQWERALNHFEFKNIKSSDSDDADIVIDFKKGKGKQVGKTLVYFDSDGFIDHVNIQISKRSFGVELNEGILEHVIKHEVGHALGLGHAQYKNSLMTTDVKTLFSNIPNCEIRAVEAANHWKIVDNGNSPSHKESDEFEC